MKKAKKNWWQQRQEKDPFVKARKKAGYRSRAAFKLLEIDKKYKLLKPGLNVVDLGAAPGGWSEIAVKKIKPAGLLVAVDLLEMSPIEGVEFIQGDFSALEIQQKLLQKLVNPKIDLILSDMAPNLTGNKTADHLRASQLADEVHFFAAQNLKEGGNLLLKYFQGSEFQPYLTKLRQNFSSVKCIKPDASRAISRELYILAQGFKKQEVQK